MANPEHPITNTEIRYFMRDLSANDFPLATLALEKTMQQLEDEANSRQSIEELGRLLGQFPESDDE